MASSPLDPKSYATTLKSYLQGVLPESQLTETQIERASGPLVLLRTDHVLAAFGFSNGDLSANFETAYGGFKNYYTQQKGAWDQFDVAFVFCVRPDIPHLDDFCSRVETDVYFCRKFVVPFAEPLGTALARLPFLPLSPLHGQSLRPPSAQTFLQQSGVPAVLAKHLVVQRERSPERIVEDCINGDYGSPHILTPTPNSRVPQAGQAAEPIRLESMTIKNFRAYRHPQTFDFGKDVTVLYGANGFGKTSFFDALDFASTGEIGRIKSRGDDHFKKTAPHLDSKPEDSSVALSFWSNGAIRKLVRTVSDRKSAMLDGIRTDRKAVLHELTSGDFPAADRVENFVSLFRATHLFNQEQPELTKDFSEDCRLPSDIVARMLAFEDYASAIAKATRVRDVLEKAISDATSQIGQLSEQITEDTKDLNRLSRPGVEALTSEALASEIETLREAVKRLGIKADSEKADAPAIRSWRASIEARLKESQTLTERLSTLAKDVSALPQARSDISRLQTQIEQDEQALKDADAQRQLIERELQAVQERHAAITRGVLTAQALVETVDWVKASRPALSRLRGELRTRSEESNGAIETVTLLQQEEEQSASALRTQEELATQAGASLSAKRSEATSLDSFVQSISRWVRSLARRQELDVSIKATEERLALLRRQTLELTPKRDQATAAVERLSNEARRLESHQSDLKSLVSKLIGHVESGTCPVCGEDHGSRQELLRRIEAHVSLDVANSARVSLDEARTQLNSLQDQLAEMVQAQQVTEEQLAGLNDERGQVESDIRGIQNSADAMGIQLDQPAAEVAGKTAAQRQARVRQEIEHLETQLKEINESSSKANAALQGVRARLAAATTNANLLRSNLQRQQAELDQLLSDQRAVTVPLDMPDEAFVTKQRAAYRDLEDQRSRVTAVQVELDAKKSVLAGLQQQTSTLRTRLTTTRTQLTNLQRVMSQTIARLDEAKLKADATEAVIMARITDEAKSQANLTSLRDRASNLELALDAATTSAALMQVRENVRNKQRAVAAAGRIQEERQPWVKYFADVSRLLSSQQNEAIENFTREYGPRTSIIQRRLRSVYGFDEVEIMSRESEISVRVKRNGEVLRPTDFFSQSQQQTLFMGLFLTACVSQTWSAFSPVFLDDPVTHFDDLNTYAFLDLVVGLLDPHVWNRQFVISTCDEKLLQLARQKFRHLSDRAKFYRFLGIGEDGPLVEEIRSV